jgi:hypothetical protein
MSTKVTRDGTGDGGIVVDGQDHGLAGLGIRSSHRF